MQQSLIQTDGMMSAGITDQMVLFTPVEERNDEAMKLESQSKV